MADRVPERVLLDTTALLAHVRGESGATDVQSILESESTEVRIAAVSVAEFARHLTALGMDGDDVQSTVLAYAGLMDEVVAVDTAIATRAWELSCIASERLPLVDSLIAAAAQVCSSTLVHRNHRFDGVPGLSMWELGT